MAQAAWFRMFSTWHSSRIKLASELIVCISVILLFNVLIVLASGYSHQYDWNWDMERLLVFTHINRMETGSSLWDIKLQRLPGLFPLYILAYGVKVLLGKFPIAAVLVTVSLSALIIQSLKLLIIKKLLVKQYSLILLALAMMSVELLITLFVPSYSHYVNASFRLSWHGDSSLINILLTLIILSQYQYRRLHLGLGGQKLLMTLIASISFLGSLSSSLYIIIVVLPLGLLPCLRALIFDYPVIKNLSCDLRKPVVALSQILNSPKLSGPFILLSSSLLGQLVLKTCREGCTPTIVGDPGLTRLAFKSLLYDHHALLPVAVSLSLWVVLYIACLKQVWPKAAVLLRNVLSLYISVPLLLVVYTFTSYGDINVFYRYGGIYALLLAPAFVCIFLNAFPLVFARLASLALFSLAVIAIGPSLSIDRIKGLNNYRNPLHGKLLKAYLQNGYSGDCLEASSASRNCLNVLVTDGIGNLATAPVLEMLAVRKIRYSQLAAYVDPRLFDQSPSEFIIPLGAGKLKSQGLAASDIRDYQYIVTTKEMMASQISLIGQPSSIHDLEFSLDGRDYVLLYYLPPANFVLKTYIAHYLNRTSDITCNTGVSWAEAFKRFLFT